MRSILRQTAAKESGSLRRPAARTAMLALACAAVAAGAEAGAVHPVPEGFEVFRVQGCTAAGLEDLRCTPESAVGRAGCDELLHDDALTGLGVPAALCLKFAPQGLPASDYLRAPQGMLQVYTRLLLWSSGGPELIRSSADLRQRFAPVRTADMALALACLVTGYRPGAELVPPASFRKFVDRLPATRTDRDGTGFLVRNLRVTDEFGCGPHATSLADVAVSVDGVVRLVESRKAFENPAEDGLCVD